MVLRRTHKLKAHHHRQGCTGLLPWSNPLPRHRLVAPRPPAPTTSGLGPEIPPCRAASGAAERLRGRSFPLPTCSRFRLTRAVAARIKRERVGGGPRLRPRLTALPRRFEVSERLGGRFFPLPIRSPLHFTSPVAA